MNLALKVRRRINRFRGKRIIQCSPIRSGSTLIYNILRDVFPERFVDKKHLINDSEKMLPIVSTCRHPFDSIASSIQRYNLEPSDKVVEGHIAEFKANGGDQLLGIADRENVLVLKYERFYSDFEYIYSSIEGFFGVKISSDLRRQMDSAYRVECVEKKAARFVEFSEFDHNQLWHGRHISRFKGEPYYYKLFFSRIQVNQMRKALGPFLEKFEYE